MREPQRHQYIFAEGTGDRRTPPPLGLHPVIKTAKTDIQHTATQIVKGRLFTTPDASDVRIQKKYTAPNPDKPTQCVNHLHPYTRESTPYALQKQQIPCTALATAHKAKKDRSVSPPHPNIAAPPPRMGGGPSKGSKRTVEEALAQGSHTHTITELTDLLNTCTDEQYALIIQQLPETGQL